MKEDTMKSTKTIWVLCALFAVVPWGADTLLAGREDARQTKEFTTRVEQIVFRAKIVSDDMSQRMSSERGALRDQERELVALTAALVETSQKLDEMMQSTQVLLENDVTARDAEIATDVQGVRTQLDGAARSMENSLQYLEHLTYKIHKLTL
jgi:hypothetical protein